MIRLVDRLSSVNGWSRPITSKSDLLSRSSKNAKKRFTFRFGAVIRRYYYGSPPTGGTGRHRAVITLAVSASNSLR